MRPLKRVKAPLNVLRSQAAELAALIHTLKGQLSKGEARAERQAAESAQVAAEHAAQIKTLEERIETLKAQLSAAETQLAERATEHDANIAAERVKTEAERVQTEAEKAKAARAIARNRERRRSWKRCGSGPTGLGGSEFGAPGGRRFHSEECMAMLEEER